MQQITTTRNQCKHKTMKRWNENATDKHDHRGFWSVETYIGYIVIALHMHGMVFMNWNMCRKSFMMQPSTIQSAEYNTHTCIKRSA